MPKNVSERAVIFLIGAIQFVNILDFVMVMPLGPDFAASLGIPASRIGLVGGSYTASAAVAGVIGSFFLERFDRRTALGVAMFGLVVGTAAGGFATGLPSLLAARVVAGFFGGPATSLAMSVIADVVPAERRGKAVGSVMGAFSVASIFGVPAGLKLAEIGGWRMPFFAVAGLGLVLTGAAIYLLPPLRLHLSAKGPGSQVAPSLGALLRRPDVRLSYGMTAAVMMAGFMLIPNLSAFVQRNLGFPRSSMDMLYAAGGVVSFVAMRFVGQLVDRYGSFPVGTLGSFLLGSVMYALFVGAWPGIPVLPLFVGFMLAMAFRNVAYNTLTSKVPAPHERAAFMSLQSAVQHLASASGAFLSSLMLSEGVGGRLVGIERVAALSIGLTILLPFLLHTVEGRVRKIPPVATGTGPRPA